MTYLTRRRRAALPLILGSVIALIAACLVGLTSVPALADSERVGPRATYVQEDFGSKLAQRKVGCNDPRLVVGNNLQKDIGNLLGGVHVWQIRAQAQDCDGYDIVSQYTIRLQKENGRCSNGALTHVNNYDFNPNSLAYWNPGTRTIDCNSGQEIYTATFAGDLRINSNDPENERCIGAKVQVDIGPVKDDYNGTVPSICFNGL